MSFLYTFESFWRGNLEVFFLNTIKRTVNTYVTNSCSCPFWESFFFFTQTAALSTKTSPHGHSQENTLSTFSFISFHHRGIPLIFWLSQKKIIQLSLWGWASIGQLSFKMHLEALCVMAICCECSYNLMGTKCFLRHLR